MQTNRSRNQWFIWQVSSLILLIFFVSAFSGLATVWLRNQIAAHASNIRAAEEESIKIEKKLDTLNAEIAKAKGFVLATVLLVVSGKTAVLMNN